MPRCLNNLYRRQVAFLRLNTPREGDMRQTDCAVVGFVRGTGEVEHRDHDSGEVRWYLAQADVDVHEGALVAAIVAGLDGDGTAFERPVGSVLGYVEAATYLMPC